MDLFGVGKQWNKLLGLSQHGPFLTLEEGEPSQLQPEPCLSVQSRLCVWPQWTSNAQY